MKAASRRHAVCVKLLLDKGAQVDLKDKVSAVSMSIIACWHVPMCKKKCNRSGLYVQHNIGCDQLYCYC